MSLISKIERSNVKDKNILFFFLGQSGYVIKTSYSIIYIDPYLTNYVEDEKGLNDPSMTRSFPPPILPENISNIDGILCTHSHVDHMDPWTLEKIPVPYNLYSSIGAYSKNPISFPENKLIFIEPGKEYHINEIKFTSIPAAHYDLTDEKGRPDALTFIININKKSYLFWGDGIIYDGLIERLKKYVFDIAFIPINGRDKEREAKGIIGNINAAEVAKLCNELSIDVLVPNHFDMFKNNSAYIDYFLQCINEFCPGQNVEVMNCGDRIEA
jgi:L-ascorbate metabolism protein UlaG (beta-lactamase superfamily)